MRSLIFLVAWLLLAGGLLAQNDCPRVWRSGDTLWTDPAESYQWFRNDAAIEGANQQFYVPQASIANSYSVEARASAQKPIDKSPLVYDNILLSYSSESYFSTLSGQLYTETDAESNGSVVDITYFYTEASGNNLASSAARNNGEEYGRFAIIWGAIYTEYRTTSLTPAQFNALNNVDDLRPEFDAGSPALQTGRNEPGTRITEIEAGGLGGQFRAGRVIAFRTSLGDRVGLILINSLARNERGSASISIKMERR